MARRRGVFRWRCLLCGQIWWNTGTPADWAYHYQLTHHDQEA